MRITVPKVLATVLGTALASYVFVLAPQLHGPFALRLVPSSPAVGETRPLSHHSGGRPFPPAGKKFIGIMTKHGPYNFTALDRFTQAVGHRPAVYEFSQSWALNQFNRGLINKVAERGMLPLISWEPWNYLKAGANPGVQPAYRLSRIIDGRYDSYIRSWAEGVKSLGYTVAIRFAHEMNGNWYPWCVFSNGNRVSQYVRAWRHVHDIFTQVGATNVIWVWAPNVIYNSFTDLARLYPGNKYVTWIGLSGYYGTPGVYAYKPFNQIFDQTLAELSTFTSKPVVITETGATNTGGLMARWIAQMFRQLPSHANIIGVIWFEATHVVDWKVADYPAAAAAFAAGFASPEYQVQWKPGMTPLLTVPAPRFGPAKQSSAPRSSQRSSPPAGPGPLPSLSASPSPQPSSSASPRPSPSASPSPTPSPSASPTPKPSPSASPSPTSSPSASPSPKPSASAGPSGAA